MTEIKAIETRYKGYRFRSRTEARWAVFFDALDMKWEYEKDGYTLPNGEKYLPDFWLPALNSFAEIKGQRFSPLEIERCRQLSKLTGFDVIMLDGTPEPRGYATYTKAGETMKEYAFRNPDAAIESALSARFEHGESGAPTVQPPRRTEGRPDGSMMAERELVRAMLGDRSRIEVIAERVGPDSFSDPKLRLIFAALLKVGEGATLDELNLDSDSHAIAAELLEGDAAIVDVRRTIDESITRLHVRDMERRIQELDKLYTLANENERIELDEEKRRLILQMRQAGKGSYRAFRRRRP
jgi:hypothetical protein